MIHACIVRKTWPLVSCFLMVIFSTSEKRVLSIQKKSSKDCCLCSVSDVRIKLQESIVRPMLWFLLLLPESSTGEVSNLARKFYILWNVRISLLLLILLLTCFKHIPFYRFPLHLYVQIHIIVVGWDWNVLELLKNPIIVRELVAQTKSREIWT